jgi:hypothetical protein
MHSTYLLDTPYSWRPRHYMCMTVHMARPDEGALAINRKLDETCQPCDALVLPPYSLVDSSSFMFKDYQGFLESFPSHMSSQ